MWKNGLLVEQPMCWTVAPKHLPKYCSYCLKPDLTTKLEKCAACKSIFYCNRSCQKADWPMHKVECKFCKVIISCPFLRTVYSTAFWFFPAFFFFFWCLKIFPNVFSKSFSARGNIHKRPSRTWEGGAITVDPICVENGVFRFIIRFNRHSAQPEMRAIVCYYES